MVATLENDFVSQKLIRCQVVGKENNDSLRFIELEHFKLWAYMMYHKHGLRIKEASLWLWVKERDYIERQDVYANFPETDEVNKIEIMLFDELNGFSHTISRYALRDESHLLEQILIKHISSDLTSAGNYEMRTQRGYCIKSGKDISNMVLGLSKDDEQIWHQEE